MSRLPPAPDVRSAAVNNSNTTARIAPSRPLLVTRSDSASSSGSSHSSHSSHIEREREAHLGESADQIPSIAKPIAAAIVILVYLFVAQAIGLWLFTGGFLLTRTSLEDSTVCLAPSTPSWIPPKPLFKKDELKESQLSQWEATLLSKAECSLPATYKQTVLWIIDALRYDFIADASITSINESWSPNSHYQNIFRLPSQLNGKNKGGFSFLSHFLADAPTTTLQRLKGLTTGSLPTFIDAGSNFGGSAITEDNWLDQMKNKHSNSNNQSGMGFVGDDTWVTVFPSVFDKAWTWPYDSFNVEDLDGVDRGVEAKLENFLQSSLSSEFSNWRLLVAHMLGVDHVGHRLGASHPRMKTKLLEMDSFMKTLLKNLPDDALLVLMGDHGMDERGDHGGDGELQVGSGLWMYSKKGQQGGGLSPSVIEEIINSSEAFIPSHLPFSPLPSPPFASRGHRSVAQIDFVPTISLLQGLPIPFNNLGSIIPEAFSNLDVLLRALRINSIQIHNYLAKYSTASRDLQPFQNEIKTAWQEALQKDAEFAFAFHASSKLTKEKAMKEACSAYMKFNRLSLIRAKGIWAKFEMTKMVTGLILLFISLLSCWAIKNQVQDESDVTVVLMSLYRKSKMGFIVGILGTILVKMISLYILPSIPLQSVSLVESIAVGAVFGAQLSYLVSTLVFSHSPSTSAILGLALPVLHSIAFSSNSFTVDEDRIVLALAITTMVYRGIQGYLSGPTTRLKIRVPAFATLAIFCLRLASTRNICREEQGQDCVSTFYAKEGDSSNSIWAIAIAYFCALILPTLISRALNMSKAFAGVAPLFINWMFRPALLLAAGYWLVDWAFTSEKIGLQESTSAYQALKWAKLALARVDLALIGIVGLSFWIFSPLCLELSKETIDVKTLPSQEQQQNPGQQRIVVLGFANSFGSSYLLLLSLVFALQFLVAQPSGQIALTLVSIALFSCAEIGDGERDSRLLNDRLAKGINDRLTPPATTLPVSFLETSTLALFGFLAFFSTGHQATFDSIQWRTAFVGFETVNYPFSPLLVFLNSFAPLALLPSMTVALLVLYNLAPKPRAAPNSTEKTERMPAIKHILLASLSFLLYHLIIAISTAVFAAHFKRHLMLFKIWTPRFMLGAVSLQLTFIGLILGLLASGNIMSKVSVTFGSHF